MSAAAKRVIPLLDRILVKRAIAPNKTKQGIMLPEKSTSKMMEATVMAVGPGARIIETGEYATPSVRVGDRVLLPSYGGTKVEIGEGKQELLLYRESDILAKLQ